MNPKYLHNQLIQWYEQNHRVLPWRETNDPYKIWVSEIILQQTRVDQGLPYYLGFIERFPDVESLATAEEDEVLLYWQGLGYYSRARNLHAAAQQIMSNFGGKFPQKYEEIRSLKGVGEYTAGAIASFAYNMAFPAMDGNVYRVISRLMDCEIAFDSTEGKKVFRKYADELICKDSPRAYNQAIMEFGALYCVPQNPICEECCIKNICKSFAHNTVNLLPIRKTKVKIKDRYLIYKVYKCTKNGEIYTLIHQRKNADIWKHLFEFVLEETDAENLTQNVASQKCIKLTHILSHQRLHAAFIVCEVDELPIIDDYFVVPYNDLGNYALSRLTLKALEMMLG